MMTLLLLLSSAFAHSADGPDATQLAAWVADLSGKDFDKHRAAMMALLAAGPKAKDAVPGLVKFLDVKSRAVTDAIDVLGAIGPDAKAAVPDLLRLTKDPKLGSGFLFNHVAIALVKIDGAKPEATLALLQTSAKGHDISLLGSSYLHTYTDKVVPHVVDLCGHKDAEIREKAARFLGELKHTRGAGKKTLFDLAGDGAKGIPAALEKLLKDENGLVVLTAANSIAQVAPQIAEKCIPVVIAAKLADQISLKSGTYQTAAIFRPVPDAAAKAMIPYLDHENADVRGWAIGTLSMLPVEVHLIVALKDSKSARIREGAAMCLGSYYSGEKPSRAALKDALTDTEFAVRFAAAVSLVRVSHDEIGIAAAAIPVLIEGLKQEDLRQSAGRNLAGLGESARAAIPTLKALLANKKPKVAFEAALVLTEIDRTDTIEAIPVLIENLTGHEYDARRATVALARIGPGAKAAIPTLLKLFNSKDHHLKVIAAEAAAVIDPAQSEKAAALFVKLLTDKQIKPSLLRDDIARALMHIGPTAKSALPTVLEIVKVDGPFRVDLALAAIAIDPVNAKPSIEWLRTQLATSGEDAFEIVELLPLLGPRAKPLIPELLAMLKSKTPHFRESACETLGAIGPDAKEALPQLKELTKDPRPSTRKAATEAIAKIECKRGN